MNALLPTKGTRSGQIGPPEPDTRLATCRFATGTRIAAHGEAHTLVPEGCDLDALRAAPLLVQHDRHADSLIGVVEEAWVDGHVLAIVRFARRPKAEEFFSMLLEGMPLACSFGYDALEVEVAADHRLDAPHYLVTGWRPFEISVVALGGDRDARFNRCDFADLAAVRDRRRAEREAAARAARLQALAPDAWRSWAKNGAAAFVGAAAGVSPTKISGPLVAAVEKHLLELQEAAEILSAARGGRCET